MATLRLATWNLLHGLPVHDPSDRRDASRRITESARALDADVIAVQEADCRSPRSGGLCHVDTVAEAIGGEGRFCAALRGVPGAHWVPGTGHADATDGPRYGIGLISRLPVTAWDSVCLPASSARLPLLVPTPSGPRVVMVRDEPRWALAAVIDSPAGPFTAVSSHLSFVPGVNVRQLRALTQWARNLPGPVVLLADTNLPHLLMSRSRGWRVLARAATYPVARPRVQFDHIAALRPERGWTAASTSPLATTDAHTTTDQTATSMASHDPRVLAVRTPAMSAGDHRALVVDIELPHAHGV